MKKILIIAEIGVNHNGSISLAKKTILAAKKSGANCVKFQYFNSEMLAVENLKKADYQKNKKKENQTVMLKALELSYAKLLELKKFSKKEKLKFMVSIFDHNQIIECNKLNEEFIKIPSGEITNLFLLKKISKLKKKIILSTGMSTNNEISLAIKTLNIKKNKLYLLQCTSEYPASIHSLNLSVLENFKKKYKCKVGFSDHSLSLISGSIAASMGSEIIEKHFTLDNKFKGPDHKASLNPKDFKKYVKNIRETEAILGNNKKRVSKIEKKNSKVVRKFLVAKNLIKKGEIFTYKNITFKRTNRTGISASNYQKLIGKKAKKNYKLDEQI